MNYSLASTSWNKSEISSIKKVIKSNNFTMGKNTSLFESVINNSPFSKLPSRKLSDEVTLC